MAELDGIFDVIICQTVFSGIEYFERSKIAMLQYGLAKEPHNYGPWRSLGDLQLAYGEYSAAFFKQYSPTVVVGNPAHDRFHDANYCAAARKAWSGRLDHRRPTIVYAPTWGDLSTSNIFIDAVAALAREYNVIVKLHHNTALTDKRRRRLPNQRSLHMLYEADDLLDTLVVADVVLSDYSGAIFDAVHCGKPVLLLHDATESRFGEKLNANSLEYRLRGTLGRLVIHPSQLADAVAKELATPQQPPQPLLDQLFLRTPNAASNAASELMRLARGGQPAPTDAQLRARESLRRDRSQTLNRKRFQVPKSSSSTNQEQNGPARRPLSQSGFSVSQALRAARLQTLPAVRRKYQSYARSFRQEASQRFQYSKVGAWARENAVPTGLFASATKRFASCIGKWFPRSGRLAIARALLHVRLGEFAEARKVLLLSQRGCPRRAEILLRIADSYRDAAEPDAAHAYYTAAARINNPYGDMRKLSFESNERLLEQGEATLTRLLTRSVTSLLPYIAMLNRVAVFYPNLATDMARLRLAARDALWREPLQSSATLNSRIRIALGARWIDDATRLQMLGRERSIRVAPDNTKRIENIRSALGPMMQVLEAAWDNEDGGALTCLHNGQLLPLTSVRARAVEFFIPTPFFAFEQSEKITYSTVRSAFRTCFEILAAREDVCIVPRHQTNWQHCRSRGIDLRISYHTRGAVDESHMHIQESTLAGRCSIDSSDFAGFATIANDFSLIDTWPASLSETLETMQRLNQQYIAANISKYDQSQEHASLPRQFVFIPLQLATDVVARLAYIDALTLLRETAKHFSGSKTKVIVKRHPMCTSATLDLALRQLTKNGQVIETRASVHQLIAASTAVITVNSGVGLEAMMHNKPVIVTGGCDYAYAARICRNVDDLHAALARPLTGDSERRLKLLHYYFHRYTVAADNRQALQKRMSDWIYRNATE